MIKKALFSLLVLSFLVAPLALNAQSVDSADEIARLIAELQRQIVELKVKLAQLQGQQSGQWCFTFEKNLGVGSGGKDVDALHTILVKEGFTISPLPVSASTGTSYEIEFKKSKVAFTEATAAAVSGFQLKYAKEILAPLGLTNPTGYVGPATRAKMNSLYGCGIPIPPPNEMITVVSPNGGESWFKGTTQKISWKSNFEKVAPIEIWLSSASTCQKGEICPPTIYASYLIGKTDTSYSSFAWQVGKASGTEVLSGAYNLQVRVVDANGYSLAKDSSDSYFKIYDSDYSGNKPPTISGVSGPTTLKIGETGTWTVQASDPENGPLSYSVVWGDEQMISGGVAAPTVEKIQQTATFTHSYAQAGTYYPKFKVTDDKGQSNSTSLSVVVGRGVIQPQPAGLDFEVMSFDLNNDGPFVRFCNRGTYSVNNFPVWITINGVTREFNMQGHWEPLVNCGLSHQWYYATWGFNAMTSSGYEGKVIVDPKNIYAETNENNNEAKASYGGGVITPNSPPIINGFALIPATIKVGERVNFTWNALDPNGDNLSWDIDWGDNTGAKSVCPSPVPYTTYTTSHIWSQAGSYTVKVGVSDCRGGEYNYSFVVSVNQSASSVQVLSPNGGETFVKGQKQIISWGATGAPEVSVYLIRDSDPSYRLAIRHNFVSGRANSIEWTVPGGDTATTDIAASSDYRIWVIGGGATAVDDKSDQPFSIATATPPPTLSIISSDPPNGAIDARDSTGPSWSNIVLNFSTSTLDLKPADFKITVSGGETPQVTGIFARSTNHNSLILGLTRSVSVGQKMTITHIPSSSKVCLGFLPGDVDQSGMVAPADILEMVDIMNGKNVPLYVGDVDRSGVIAPADQLAFSDILNATNGKTLPACPAL